MRVFLFLDYDGTLVPIRSIPGKAVIAPRTKALLKELAKTPRVRVAIVSGRSLKDITALVGLKGLIYAGNHGLEIKGPGISYKAKTGKGFEKSLVRICSRLEEKLSSIKGVLVESKGKTLSLHFRLVPPEKLPVVLRVFRDITNQYVRTKKIRIDSGKKVLEVKPPVDWDKGKAVRWILHRLKATPANTFPVYIGDDATDESAFKALSKQGMTVFVGRSGSTCARYRLQGPRQVTEFLRKIREVCHVRL